MLLLFYPPFRAETDEELEYQTVIALHEYLEDLAEFPAALLAAGWKTVRREHKVERWPTIGAIRAACQEAQAQSRAAPARKSGGVSQTVRALRLQGFQRTGVWLDDWGERPQRQDEARVINRDYWRRFAERASPESQRQAREMINRLRAGESAGKLLQEVLASHGRR